MDEKGYLKNILFIDIETVSLNENYNELPDRLQKEWDRKSQYINNKEELDVENLFKNKAAIFSEFGKVIVIGLGILYYDENKKLKTRTIALHNSDEKELLKEFKAVTDKFHPENLILCAHNGKEFDFPYLARRMVINSIELPEVLKLSGKKPWQINHLDTMEMWKFGDRKNYTSLELICACLNIPSSKTDLDGSQITAEYYERHGVDRIKKYCEADVENVIQVYLRLNQ